MLKIIWAGEVSRARHSCPSVQLVVAGPDHVPLLLFLLSGHHLHARRSGRDESQALRGAQTGRRTRDCGPLRKSRRRHFGRKDLASDRGGSPAVRERFRPQKGVQQQSLSVHTGLRHQHVRSGSQRSSIASLIILAAGLRGHTVSSSVVGNRFRSRWHSPSRCAAQTVDSVNQQSNTAPQRIKLAVKVGRTASNSRQRPDGPSGGLGQVQLAHRASAPGKAGSPPPQFL
jgi:hypothetical protein